MFQSPFHIKGTRGQFGMISVTTGPYLAKSVVPPTNEVLPGFRLFLPSPTSPYEAFKYLLSARMFAICPIFS